MEVRVLHLMVWGFIAEFGAEFEMELSEMEKKGIGNEY